MDDLTTQEEMITSSRTTAKLNRLYQGKLPFPQTPHKNYIKLSNTQLEKNKEILLFLGLKCPYKPKFNAITKQLELEVLYSKLLTMEQQNMIEINSNLPDLLRAEATKHRDFNKSDLVNPDMLKTAKSLKNHPDIIIHRADKSSIAIVFNKTDYKTKLDNILQDSSKFKRITSNPINLLKITVNKLIATINKKNNNKILSPIVGEYAPGYIYGVVKIHKDNNPLRTMILYMKLPNN